MVKANSLDASTTGVVRFTGTGFTASTVTANATLVGSTSNAITSVGPGTSGTILQSQGSSSDPAFSSAVYPTTTTANAVLYSSSTNTLAEITPSANGVMIASNSGVPSWLSNGTAGYLLTANTGAPPSWQAGGGGSGFTSINTQVFNSSGTYTPTGGMTMCQVECFGGGGAGGGADALVGTGTAFGGGGGGAEYIRAWYKAATIGASKTVTLGAGGNANVGAAGGDGGATTFGSLITTNGGLGGALGSCQTNVASYGNGGAPGSGGSANSQEGSYLHVQGEYGGYGIGFIITGQAVWAWTPGGGNSYFGGAGGWAARSVAIAGNAGSQGDDAGSQCGSGGGGAVQCNSVSNFRGGYGSPGRVIVTEFIS